MAYKNLEPFKLGFTSSQMSALRQISNERFIPMTELVRCMVDYVLASPLELELILDAKQFKKDKVSKSQ